MERFRRDAARLRLYIQGAMNDILQLRKQKRQAGFTLVELMIAVLVLTFGLLALTALFATAIGNNGRSRVDSTATMLSESVIEQITAALARGGPSSVTDCAGTSWPVCNPNSPDPNCPAGTNGANVQTNSPSIDFGQTNVPYGYSMNYAVCNGGGLSGTQAVYDVRWNIEPLSTAPSSSSYLVTVSARPQNMANNRFTFALPVTFRTYVGPE